jgi:kinetochore protein NNF1
MRKEFESVLVERNVVASLNELDRLVEDAQRRKAQSGDNAGRPVPAHTLPPKQLYISRLAPSLKEYAGQIGTRQVELGEENLALMRKVEAQRAEIRRLVEGLEGVVGDLKGSVEVLHGEGNGEVMDG